MSKLAEVCTLRVLVIIRNETWLLGYIVWEIMNNTLALCCFPAICHSVPGALNYLQVDCHILVAVDIQQFFIYLGNYMLHFADGEMSPEIELMYRSDVDYGMPDLSAASYQDFTDR